MPFRLTPDDKSKRPPGEAESRGTSRRRRRVRQTLAVLPTLFTLGNLLCGFAAIFLASRPADTPLPWHWTPLTFAAVFVFLGMVMDGLDGRVARMTRSTSDLGEQLDSMADMVTFGVAPAFTAIQLIAIGTPFVSETKDELLDRAVLVIACIYVACAALRLARFNAEVHKASESDHMSFKGLPSPAAAGTVASFVLLHQHYFVGLNLGADHPRVRYSALGMVAIMLLAAFAMVSRMRYAHVMNRYLRGRAGLTRIGMLVIPLLLMLISVQHSFALLFAAYALSAPLVAVCRLVTGHPALPAPGTAAPSAAAAPPTGDGKPGADDQRSTG
ncbi:MAG: phosphatidylcholine/phosphatidylserine synthase [Planctomycetota bacterium]|nr:phosphatidylcholine/phosphatidylserine synthase [Planctomycetota bacterium]